MIQRFPTTLGRFDEYLQITLDFFLPHIFVQGPGPEIGFVSKIFLSPLRLNPTASKRA